MEKQARTDFPHILVYANTHTVVSVGRFKRGAINLFVGKKVGFLSHNDVSGPLVFKKTTFKVPEKLTLLL